MAGLIPCVKSDTHCKFVGNQLVEPEKLALSCTQQNASLEPVFSDMIGEYPNIDVDSSFKMKHSGFFYESCDDYPQSDQNQNTPNTSEHILQQCRSSATDIDDSDTIKQSNVDSDDELNCTSYTIVNNEFTDNEKNKTHPSAMKTDDVRNRNRKNNYKVPALLRRRRGVYKRKRIRRQVIDPVEPAEQINNFITISFPNIDLERTFGTESLNKHVENFVKAIRSRTPWADQPFLESSKPCLYCKHCHYQTKF
ncbi:uncharacterized protein LOC119690094 [Teleopsis dalmanni]|uniref:uncharacterized protein LOC119690094 n=1 Tax=Teleopsis dalmanni TaxID=139649 RepID=UPI0018CCA67E|nr:uncharacterized protein LOC119690094 [Teleopsis dalmanni]